MENVKLYRVVYHGVHLGEDENAVLESVVESLEDGDQFAGNMIAIGVILNEKDVQELYSVFSAIHTRRTVDVDFTIAVLEAYMKAVGLGILEDKEWISLMHYFWNQFIFDKAYPKGCAFGTPQESQK